MNISVGRIDIVRFCVSILVSISCAFHHYIHCYEILFLTCSSIIMQIYSSLYIFLDHLLDQVMIITFYT